MGKVQEWWEDAWDYGKEKVEDVREVFSNLDDAVHDSGGWGLAVLSPSTFAYNAAMMSVYSPEIPEFPNMDANLGVRETRLNVNTQSAVNKVPVIYGTPRVGGLRVHTFTSGIDDEFLHIIIVWCEGQIAAVVDVYVNGINVDDAHYVRDGVEHAWAYNHVGTDDQTVDTEAFLSSTTVSVLFELNGFAYSHVKLRWNPDCFDGSFPVVTADIRGKRVYDPRSDITAYSNNLALCLRDYLTNSRYGKGIPEAALDSASFEAFADYCEETIKYATYPIYRYEVNGCLETTNTIWENLQLFFMQGMCWLNYVGGKYKVRYHAAQDSRLALTKDNIIGGWSFSSGGKRNLLNQVEIALIETDNGEWRTTSIFYDETDIRTNQDQGELLSRSITLPLCVDKYQALMIAKTYLNLSRMKLAAAVTCNLEAMNLEVGDVVTVTHDTPGWSSKYFQVTGITLLRTANVRLVLREYSVLSYPSTLTEEFIPPDTTTLPSTFEVSPPENLFASSEEEHLIRSSSGDIISRIYLTWDVPSDDKYIKKYQVQFKKSTSETWIPAALAEGRENTSVYIAPVEDLVSYDIRVRSVNYIAVSSEWTYVYGHSVIGKSTPPPDVTTFTVTIQGDSTRQLAWTIDDPPIDLKGVQIRYALWPTTGWDNMTPLHTGTIPNSPYETNQLAAGTYNFAIKAVDTSNNESENELYVEGVNVPDPRLKNVVLNVDEFALGWPGTLSDCFITRQGFIEADGTLTWDDMTATGLPASWDEWDTWNLYPNSPIYYETEEIDLGGEITFTPYVSVYGTGNVYPMIDYATDGGSYAGFSTVPTSPITARYVKIRVYAEQTSALEVPRIDGLDYRFDGKQVEEYINDLVIDTDGRLTANHKTGSNTGDIRVPITEDFAIFREVVVIFQGTTGGYTYTIVDKVSADALLYGPRVQLFDSSFSIYNSTGLTIDVIIRGY